MIYLWLGVNSPASLTVLIKSGISPLITENAVSTWLHVAGFHAKHVVLCKDKESSVAALSNWRAAVRDEVRIVATIQAKRESAANPCVVCCPGMCCQPSCIVFVVDVVQFVRDRLLSYSWSLLCKR